MSLFLECSNVFAVSVCSSVSIVYVYVSWWFYLTVLPSTENVPKNCAKTVNVRHTEFLLV